MAIITILCGIYIGTSVSAYVSRIIHSNTVVGVTKISTQKPKTITVSTPAVTKTTATATPTQTKTATPATTPTPAPAPVVVPAPSSEVTSLTPTAPSTTNNTNPVSSYTSTNWSGYLATTGTFTAISGAWTVPQPTGNGTTTTSDAAWIGIGGVTTNDLIQVGTYNTVTAAGQVTTSAFYELLPAPAQEILTMVVHPGDSMEASLSESNGQWTITITDLTSSQTFTIVVTYTSSHSSADWIQEDPSYLDGTLVPFDTFGSINFTKCLTTRNGTSIDLLATSAVKVTMVNQAGTPVAVPSAIGVSGSGFSVSSQ